MKYLVLLLLLSGCVNVNSQPRVSCDELNSKIKIVGGCDKYGDCGAVLEDGTVVRDSRMAVSGAKPMGPHCRVVPQ